MTISTEAPPPGDPRLDSELRETICSWLKDNGIDPALVPAAERPMLTEITPNSMPRLGHNAPMVLDVRLWVRGPDGPGPRLNEARTALIEEQHTVPIYVAPPPVVRAWLDAKCPGCGR